MALPSSGRGFTVEIENLTQIRRVYRTLGNPDAPFLREAVEEAGEILVEAVNASLPAMASTPGHRSPKEAFKPRALGVKGKGANLRFVVSVAHRSRRGGSGVRAYEFGRYASYGRKGANRGRANAGLRATLQQRHRSGGFGQPARPFLGIVSGGGAIGAARPRVEKILGEAFLEEHERLWGRGA